MISLTQKEQSLLKDLRSQEQLCVEKYGKYADKACDGGLKNLFTAIGQQESEHLQTLDQIAAGTVPQFGGPARTMPAAQPSACCCDKRENDAYLCSDALGTEKHVSSEYNTCIFEFADPGVRNCLNHIQTEEQRHGEHIWNYMSVNGMYSG